VDPGLALALAPSSPVKPQVPSIVATRTLTMSNSQFHQPQSGVTRTLSTRMFTRRVSAAFSLARPSAVCGMSQVRSVKAQARERKVPDVLVVRSTSMLLQAARHRHSTSEAAAGRARGSVGDMAGL
jgi:hypothetical protein